MKDRYIERRTIGTYKHVSRQPEPVPGAKPFGSGLRVGDLIAMGVVEKTHEETVEFFGADYASDASVFDDIGDYPADDSGGALPVD